MQDIVFEISKHIHNPPLKILLKLLGTKLYNYVKITEFTKPYSKYITNKRIKLFPDLLMLDISYYPEDMNLDYSNEYYTTLTELPTQLKVLNIEGNQRITDENIWYLPLKKLICNNNITDNAVKHLTQLEVLNCGIYRKITEEGIKDLNLKSFIGMYKIRNITHMTNLRYLYIDKSDTIITNNEMKHLNLISLYAPEHITDEGIKHMKLHRLSGTRISSELLQKLNLYRLGNIFSDLKYDDIKHMNLHSLVIYGKLIDISKFKLHMLSLKSIFDTPNYIMNNVIGDYLEPCRNKSNITINDDMVKNMDLKYIEIYDTSCITDEAFKNMKPFVIRTGGMNDIEGKYINRDNLERIVLSKPCISYTGNKNIRKMKFVSAYDNGSLF